MKLARLIPFPGSETGTVKLIARAERGGNLLSLEFELSEATGILLPEPASTPQRMDRLWEHTCFEAFIGESGNSRYWELNLSPSLDWNLYRFEEYRAGMATEESAKPPVAAVSRSAGGLKLRAELALEAFLPASAQIELGITAVLERDGAGCSYWALAHCGDRPDFHLRESFLLAL